MATAAACAAPERFELHDAADDAALLVQGLGIDKVVTVGYSMGGPISLLLARRHPHLVRGMVVEATALEWRAKWYERPKWKAVHVVGFLRTVAGVPALDPRRASASCWARTTNSLPYVAVGGQ